MIKRKDMLGLVDATAEEIYEILDTAANMKKLLKQGIKKLPHLEGCTATILFYENSTRTRTSFEQSIWAQARSISRRLLRRWQRAKRSSTRARRWTR